MGTCITKHFPHVFRKPNLSPIINRPYNRHDECRRITWLFFGDGERIPTHLDHGLHCFSIHVVHLIDLLLYFIDHHGRLFLKGEFFIEEHFPSRIHLTYPRFKEATIREVSPFTKFPLRVPRFFLIPSQPSKNLKPSLVI